MQDMLNMSRVRNDVIWLANLRLNPIDSRQLETKEGKCCSKGSAFWKIDNSGEWLEYYFTLKFGGKGN